MYQHLSQFVLETSLGVSLYGLLGRFAGVLAQDDGAAEAAGEELPFIAQLINNPFFPIAGVMFLFYFMLIAPDRKRRAEEAKRIAAIKKGDRVVTAGGLHGKVSAARSDSDVVTVQLDENGNVRVKVSRWALSIASDEKKKPEESK